MKNMILFFALCFLGINAAKSQSASFFYTLENTTVVTKNTSNFTFTPTDSFVANWYFLGAGEEIYQNYDSASYSFYENGDYTIFLIINHLIKSSNNPNSWVLNDTSSYSQSISVKLANKPKIEGVVKWRGNSISNGLVHLLKLQNGKYFTSRTKAINPNGSYQFENLSADTFKIWVEPYINDTLLVYPTPTYYGNSNIMDSAWVVIPTANLSNINIDLTETAELNGTLGLRGKVFNGNVFLGNTSLLLYSSNKSKLYKYTQSNSANGEYVINKIEPGNYLLQPILNGVSYMPLNITITNTNNLVDIDLSTLTTSVKNVFAIKETFNVYPNPFTNTININYLNNDELKSVFITNMQGKVVCNYENLNSNSLQLSELESGLYFITITDTNNNLTSKRILKN